MPNVPTLLLTTNYPPHVGGMEEYCSQLARHLGHGPVFVGATRAAGDREFDASERARGVRVFRAPFERGRANRFACVVVWWIMIVPLVLRHGIRFLHCGNLTPTGYLGYWTKKLLGIPYSVIFYGMDVERAIRKRERGGLRARIVDRIVADADVLFAISRDTRDRLVRLGIPANRVRILHPGVDAERFRPASEAADGAAADEAGRPAVLLTVGRYAARKGVADVLRALPRLLERRNCTFVVVGREQEENLLPLVRELKLENHVRFAGEVSPEELPAFYRGADLFVMPSREDPATGSVEGFGIVFLEAAACGIPAIGGRSGGMADAIVDGETGFLVAPGNAHDLIARLTELLTDRALHRRLSVAARVRAESEFSWAAMGSRAAHEMHRALGETPSP